MGENGRMWKSLASRCLTQASSLAGQQQNLHTGSSGGCLAYSGPKLRRGLYTGFPFLVDPDKLVAGSLGSIFHFSDWSAEVKWKHFWTDWKATWGICWKQRCRTQCTHAKKQNAVVVYNCCQTDLTKFWLACQRKFIKILGAHEADREGIYILKAWGRCCF